MEIGDRGSAAILQMVATESLWPASRRFEEEGGREEPTPTGPQSAHQAGSGEEADCEHHEGEGQADGGLQDVDNSEAEVDFDLGTALEDNLGLADEEEDPWEEPQEAAPAHLRGRGQEFCATAPI